MIFVFGPERIGSTSVMRLFSGHNRVQCQFISDKYNRVTVAGFMSKDNLPGDGQISEPPELVVLMIRDPIARVVSECFHKVDEGEIEPCPDDTEPAIWVMAVGDHSAMLDHIIYEVFKTGVDIFGTPFHPPVTRYATKPPVLVCRLKDIDALPKALGENGFPMFGRKITRENVCSYPELKFPKCYVDRMMENAYTEHFYSEKEIVEMRKKWTHKPKTS
jgi:hypothetical protein